MNVLLNLIVKQIFKMRAIICRALRRLGMTETLLESYRGADKSLARPGRKQTTATEDFQSSYILFIIIIGGILVLFIYITKLASKEIFSPSINIHGEVGRAKDLSAPLYYRVADKSLARPGRKQATATLRF